MLHLKMDQTTLIIIIIMLIFLKYSSFQSEQSVQSDKYIVVVETELRHQKDSWDFVLDIWALGPIEAIAASFATNSDLKRHI